MLSRHKPLVERMIRQYVVPVLRHVRPEILTVIGVVPAGLFFIFLSQQWYLAALVSLFGLIVDSVDGAVARATGRVTKFGGFLDSVMDRVADALLVVGFGVSGLVPWSLVSAMLVGAFLISYMRSRAELAAEGKIKLTAGLMERTERVIGFGVCAIFALWCSQCVVYVFSGILVLVAITIFQRGFAAYKVLIA